MRWLPYIAALSLLAGAEARAQSPTSTPGSVSFRMHPLVPAAGDRIELQIDGTFGSSNADMSLDSLIVEPELVTVYLGSAWRVGTTAATDDSVTLWSVRPSAGSLPSGVYDLLVRENGVQSLFSFFPVESTRPEPAVLPAPAPSVIASQPVGINLGVAKDHSHMLIFTDVFKLARAWISHRVSDDTWDSGTPFDLDSLGWVRSLAPDQEAGTLMLLELGSAYPGGRYTVLYDGDGWLDFDWDARVIDRQPGQIDLWVTPEEGIHLVLRQTDPSNYVRNIRVLMPGSEDVEPGFHPNYVRFLRQFNVLRFMDWVDSNEPENNVASVGLWSARITPQHATQGTIRGVALEYMIDLANEVGADPWFSVPVVATDAYVDSMATLIHTRLDPQRRAYIELSNEVWNPAFPQNAVAVARGVALGYADAEAAQPFGFLGFDQASWLAGLRYYSERSVQVFDAFDEVFVSPDRLVRVLAGWQIDDVDLAVSIASIILDWRDAHMRADAYAVAPYFGFFVAADESVDFVTDANLDVLVDSVATDMRFMLDIGRRISEETSARGVRLLAYEGGHHMVQATETPYPTEQVRMRAGEIHDDERMYDIYTEYLAGWYDITDHMNLFTDSSSLGNFGLLSRWDQTPPSAKYRAVQDFLQSGTLDGDGDSDGDIDFDDFFAFADAFGGTDPRFDFDDDADVDFDDFFAFADAFNAAGQR